MLRDLRRVGAVRNSDQWLIMEDLGLDLVHNGLNEGIMMLNRGSVLEAILYMLSGYGALRDIYQCGLRPGERKKYQLYTAT